MHTACRFTLLFLMVAVCGATSAHAQSVAGTPPEGAPPPALTYHGLVPGVHTLADVLDVLGEPEKASPWYDYKLYYPSKDRPGLYDIVHVEENAPDARFANVDAASVPEGYESEAAIRERLGEPEYELRMQTWKLLDYTEQGVRFTLTAEGKTHGVAYVPHGYPRVPAGERALVDLTGMRKGPQEAGAQAVEYAGLRAGASEVVFTPTGEDWLGHPYTVHDDLKARTIVFSDGELTVGFVGADLFGMGWNETFEMRRRAHDLGVDVLIIAMSHNHAAGDTIGVYGHYPAEYIAQIQDRVTEGVKLALEDLRPVRSITSYSTELPMDGTRVVDLFRNARNPGVMDPTVSVMQVMADSGEPIATVVHFACHVESLEAGPREISADFPGYMCDRIKEDGGGQAVFLNGAVGGMVSGDNFARTHESSREMGLQLASLVKALAGKATPVAGHAFDADVRRIEIPMTNDDFAPLYDSGLRNLYRGRVVSDMMYVRLGEAQFVTIPGELLPEVSFEILEHMNGYPAMLVGLANDELGYLIPPYDFRQGFYEESMSQGPSAALQVRDMAIRMITEAE